MRGTGATLAVMASVMLAACGSAATTPTPTATASASVVRLTASQKAQVQTILTGNLSHYQAAFTAGKAALAQPGNAFYNWRHASNVEQDVSYLDASKLVNALYTAENQPDSLVTTEQDLSTVQSDIAAWVSVAVRWQIKNVSDADLLKAEQTVDADVATVQKDITALIAAS